MEKMKKLEDLFQELTRLSRDILAVEKASGFLDGNDDLSELAFNMKDPEDMFRWNEARDIMESLDAARSRLAYMDLPVAEKGRLSFNPSTGRLFLPSGEELHCGAVIDVLVTDDVYFEYPYWHSGRIEHDGEKFYITGNKNVPLVGIMARRRERRR